MLIGVQNSYPHFSQTNPQGTDKKRFMNKKNKIILLAAMIVAAVCARQRTCRYQRGNKYGDLLLRSRHETHLRHRCRGGSHRRHQGVWQILLWRPRHEQDCRKLVRSLHLPHRECNHSPLVLPII